MVTGEKSRCGVELSHSTYTYNISAICGIQRENIKNIILKKSFEKNIEAVPHP